MEFLHQLSNYQLLKKGSAAWSLKIHCRVDKSPPVDPILNQQATWPPCETDKPLQLGRQYIIAAAVVKTLSMPTEN
jgi:hypothetical protein